jgi:hypothetical protein
VALLRPVRVVEEVEVAPAALVLTDMRVVLEILQYLVLVQVVQVEDTVVLVTLPVTVVVEEYCYFGISD